jgi:hypothetical protein
MGADARDAGGYECEWRRESNDVLVPDARVGRRRVTPRLTPMSGELHERRLSPFARASGAMGRARRRRAERLHVEIAVHPARGTAVYLGIRLVALLVVVDLAWSLLVVRGARPALAFYVLALCAAPVGCALALLSEGLGPRDEIGDTTTSWGPADLNLRVLMGVAIILLAAALVGLGLRAERYGSTSKAPTATCVMPAHGLGMPLVGVWHSLRGDCAGE